MNSAIQAYLSNPLGFLLAIAALPAFGYVCYRFAKDDGGWPELKESRRVIADRDVLHLQKTIKAFSDSIRI